MKNKNDIKLLALCDTSEKLFEDDLKKCIKISLDKTNQSLGSYKMKVNFITTNKIKENTLYTRIIEEIKKNKRKSKFTLKIDFNDFLILYDYPIAFCFCNDDTDVIQARVELDASIMKNIRLKVYITVRQPLEEYMDLFKNTPRNY